MSETTPTIRDRVWPTVLDLVASQDRVTVDAVLDAGALTESQRDTTRAVLNAMADMGRLDHQPGSPIWRRPSRADPVLTHFRNRNANMWTFTDSEIRDWVESRLEGRVLNLCAGKTRLTHDGEIGRNDKNTEWDADYHFDAVAVADHFPSSHFDTVVVDPPWNAGLEKSRPKYQGKRVDNYTRLKNGVAEVLRPDGRVLMFGYDSSGLGTGRGFQLEEVAVMHFTGRHHDALATVERQAPCSNM